jgi:dipeptidyl-peptidase 4
MKFILVVSAAIATLSNAKSVDPKQTNGKTPFEFDEVVPNAYGQRGFNGVWISGNEFTYSSNGDFVKYNVETKATETILEKKFIQDQGWSGASFRVSADLKKVLVRYAQRQIFRHSTVSKFSIVFLDTPRSIFQIAKDEGKDQPNEIQIAFFTPNGNGLAYIQDNNIYYLNFNDFGLPKIITADGIPGVVYNGIPDWVYEEEVLGTDAATWFSPDGNKMAFIRFNDEKVREAVYELYGEGDRQYPEEIHLRYPKVSSWEAHVITRDLFAVVPGWHDQPNH